MNHVMMNRASRRLVWGVVGMVMVMAMGCETPPRNQGYSDSYRLDSRLPDEGPQLGSVDLVVATDRAVEQIAARIGPKPTGERTVIVMDRVENQTSDPTANFQIYLARIRASLNQSGATSNLVFVETRNRADAIKQREGVEPADHARTRPQFALAGIFHDMPRGYSNYYLLTFQLVDLGNDQLVWEQMYEVKL